MAPAEREKLVSGYADRTVTLLRQAMAHGFKDSDYLQRTHDFDPLRARDDFKKVIAEMEKK